MKIKRFINKKEIIIIVLSFAISLVTGIYSNDIIIGGTTVFTGLLSAYYASIGKRINYIFGLINYIIMGYVAYLNNLYGIFFFYLAVFSPLQIKGLIEWNKHQEEDGNVEQRYFTKRNSIIIIVSCLIASVILAYILSIIPRQRLPIMDALSNTINLCGVILLILRFKEAWYIWLVNNVIDLMIWLITFINNGSNSFMMLVVSIGYLLINIYGIINWTKNRKD